MRTLLLYFIVLAFPFTASAHGDDPSFERTQSGYVIDIGYDKIGFRPGEEVTFDFDMFTEGSDMDFVPFKSVIVTILKDGAGIKSTTIPNRDEYVPTWKYTFAEAGDYVMHVEYLIDDRAIESDFDIPVKEDSGTIGRYTKTATIVAAVLLVCASLGAIALSIKRGGH